MSSRIRLLILTGAIAFLLACGGISVALWQASDLGQLAAAQWRWAQRPFARYEIVIQQALAGWTSNVVVCQQTLTVEGERVSQITLSDPPNCRLTVRTVGELFTHITGALTARNCGPNGCSCDGPIVPVVAYDEVLGYPQRVDLQLHFGQRALYPEYWRRYWFGGYCTMIGYAISRYRVVSLTPLP
jgi:hypothetical protein